jgi:hypothetical protein
MSETQPRGRLRIDRIAALILLRSAQRQSTTATSNDAGLNMTSTPEMRDLAYRLLAYEAGADKASEPMESLTLRVYEKLRQSLNEFVGVAGFQSLVSRALTLARPEAPSLSAARVAADGSLQGLGEIETQFDLDNNQAGDGGIILIAHLFGLLRIFLGEALTLSLLRNAWPGEVFDDRNSLYGRSA